MIIKCKMCGGDIEFTPGATYGTCEYCGSTSTIPKADDEGKLNRYNRANHFRRQCEFDKALAAYEKILEQDDTDAEAHWGAALSRYGIEYVEDPATQKRIPTCHRVQVASILADADYLAAVENAPDAESRRLYEEQAAQIAEIQKGILAISANEKPYDVFICYKETDDNGQRTRDSQWAQDVYYGLTDAGYKVFFSRITLEDKLGQQYEPYIFAALNSAKVMVVVGSKPEYFNAVWVKNEWSRYLALMAKDRTRLLIPCYRDMDPYDLPEELSTLQSQDMGKIGFMQDLLRGVKKVLETDKKPEQSKTVQQVARASVAGIAPGISSLMERTYLFMEDGDFDSAADYINRVLDIDPKYAPAYAAKVCVTFRLRKESDLAETTFLYEDNADWQKAIRFADSKQKTTYAGYIAQVKVRVARQIRNYAYDCAMEMAVTPQSDQSQLDSALSSYKASCTHSDSSRADGSRRKNSKLNEDSFKQAVRTNEPGDVSEQGFKHAAAMFDNIKDSDATECAKQCRILAEQAQQKLIYNNAVTAHNDNRYNVTGLEETATLFLSVPQYKDAKEQAQHCMDEAETIRDGWYSDAIKAMQEAGDESKKWKKVKNVLALSSLDDYRDVAQLRTQATKRYEECLAAEKEAQRKIEEQAHREAKAAAEKKRLKTILVILAAVVAVAAFLVVTRVIIPRINYKKAEKFRANGQYAEAVAAFMNAGSYSDAETQIAETKYQQAKSLVGKKDYTGAVKILTSIRGYKDVDNLIANDQNLAAARVAKYAVGNYVTFGTYPQTSGGNDNTPIEWLVLARDGNKALLISRYGLDVQPYNKKYMSVTWEKCSLRTWLNGAFMNKAFTANEQTGILLTNVDNSSQGYNSKWSTNGGNNTQDKIFLLSIAEANQYLDVTYDDSKNMKSRVSPTAYASKQGAYTTGFNKTADGVGAVRWCLRSSSNNRYSAAYVEDDGSFCWDPVNCAGCCVRPALWVNLESGIF